MRASVAAPAAVLSLDGWAWRDAGAGQAGDWERLAETGDNRLLFRLPADRDGLARWLDSRSAGQTMVCAREGTAVGAGAISQRNRRSLNAHLTIMFSDPEIATLPAAIYVRHLFWSMPLHRLYAQLPVVDSTSAYVTLLSSVGFREEGYVKDFAAVGEKRLSVIVMGLLRPDFDEWCRTTEPRLAL